MYKFSEQTTVAVATKTKVRVGLATRVLVSLGVLGTTAAFVAVTAPDFADSDMPIFSRRAQVSVSVEGSGLVTSSPQGISCPGRCEAQFPIGKKVTLTAAPQPNSIFANWQGACQGAGDCVVVPGSSAQASAVFQVALPKVSLTVSVQGGGRVNSNPGGIICGSDCSESYTAGSTITLIALPSAGTRFAGWSGVCKGLAAMCVVTLSDDSAATASFAPIAGS